MKFQLTIDIGDNTAMQTGEDLAYVLIRLGERMGDKYGGMRLEQNETGTLADPKGKTVGSWAIKGKKGQKSAGRELH